jgi:hypothetical protein
MKLKSMSLKKKTKQANLDEPLKFKLIFKIKVCKIIDLDSIKKFNFQLI